MATYLLWRSDSSDHHQDLGHFGSLEEAKAAADKMIGNDPATEWDTKSAGEWWRVLEGGAPRYVVQRFDGD